MMTKRLVTGAGIALLLSIMSVAPAMAADDISDVDVTTPPATDEVTDAPTDVITLQATVPYVEAIVDDTRQSNPLVINDGSYVRINISNLGAGDSVEGVVRSSNGTPLSQDGNRSEGGENLSLDFTVSCEAVGGSIDISRTVGETGEEEHVTSLSLQAAPGACGTAPEPTDPEPTDPAPTDPEPTDPAPTDPVDPTDPAPTDPAPTDPVDPTDPAPTDPEPTDPLPTDPTEPEPTDPTNPDPTDPAPTDPVDPTDPAPTTPVDPTQPPAPTVPAGPESPAAPVDSGRAPEGSSSFNDAGSQLRERFTEFARSQSPRATAPVQQSDDLPHTGASVEGLGALALGLVAVGGVTLAARRRSDA